MAKLDFPSFTQSFASGTGLLLITTVTGYGFTYLFLLVMGRLLGSEAFGIIKIILLCQKSTIPGKALK